MQEEFTLLLPGFYLEGLQIYSLTYTHSRLYLNVHRNKTKLKLYTSFSGFSFIYCKIWQFVTFAWVGGIMPTHSLCKFSAMSLDSLTFNHHKKWCFSFFFNLPILNTTVQTQLQVALKWTERVIHLTKIDSYSCVLTRCQVFKLVGVKINKKRTKGECVQEEKGWEKISCSGHLKNWRNRRNLRICFTMQGMRDWSWVGEQRSHRLWGG